MKRARLPFWGEPGFFMKKTRLDKMRGESV